MAIALTMTALPTGIDSFLASAGWGDAQINPLPGDASFRRYFRLVRGGGDLADGALADGGLAGGTLGDGTLNADVSKGGRKAMLMHAPPPEEDPQPFLHVARYLTAQGLRAPGILAEDAANGWVLTEDFGDDRMRDWLDQNSQGEEGAYRSAIDTLVTLRGKPAGPLDPYDMEAYLREVELLTQWYCRAMDLQVDEAGFVKAWEEALAPLLSNATNNVTVLRDYHAENIMLLSPQSDGSGEQGLIDFQDALIGHPAYDLVSLLQDARREVSLDLERKMIGYYADSLGLDAPTLQDFQADYARLGAQRNAKIVGIFTRLCRRDGKPRYLSMIPRVWRAMERDLAHPALAPVSAWFDANIPQSARDDNGGIADRKFQ